MSKIIFKLWVYVVPIPLCAVMYWAWLRLSGSFAFSLYVMLLPLVYGYVAPGIATNLLKKWRFKGPGLIGNYYIHHGFIYAADMSPLLYIAFLGVSTQHAMSVEEIVRIALCAAAIHGYVMWIHEVYIVRLGMVEIFNRPAAEGKSPEAVVFHYAPLSFFMQGITYAASSLYAFQVFVIEGDVSLLAIAKVVAVGILLMFSLPSLVYRYWGD